MLSSAAVYPSHFAGRSRRLHLVLRGIGSLHRRRPNPGLFAARLRRQEALRSLALRQLYAFARRVSSNVIVAFYALRVACCSRNSFRRFELKQLTLSFESYHLLVSRFFFHRYIHIIMNLLIQLMLGIPLELVHKGWRIMIVYILGALMGGLAHSVIDGGQLLA